LHEVHDIEEIKPGRKGAKKQSSIVESSDVGLDKPPEHRISTGSWPVETDAPEISGVTNKKTPEKASGKICFCTGFS